MDEIISLSKNEIIGQSVFSDTNAFLKGSFFEFNFVPGVILIEAMAQCGGAGIKKLGLADGLFGLANIENASFFKGVKYGKTFKMAITNIKIRKSISAGGNWFRQRRPLHNTGLDLCQIAITGSRINLTILQNLIVD